MKKKQSRSRLCHSDILACFQRKQHLETVMVILCHFLAALGNSRFDHAEAKSPAAISRLLNKYGWSLKSLIRVLRHHAMQAFRDYLREHRGRPPMIVISIDLTSLGKEGEFSGLDGWIHTWNKVRGLHVIMIYICCGSLKIPWGFKIWRGKGTPSPSQLALRLVRQLPDEIRARIKNVHLFADAGFESEEFMTGITELGYHFTIGVRANRLTDQGQHIKDITSQQRRIRLDGVDRDLWLYWVWLPAKKGDKQEQRFIVSSVQRTPKIAKKNGKRRWKIEALFKTLKSRFAFGKFQQGTKLGVIRYLCLSLAAFLLAHFEELDQLDPNQKEHPLPDWGALAEQVRMKYFGWVLLFEYDIKRRRILAFQDEAQGIPA